MQSELVAVDLLDEEFVPKMARWSYLTRFARPWELFEFGGRLSVTRPNDPCAIARAALPG